MDVNDREALAEILVAHCPNPKMWGFLCGDACQLFFSDREEWAAHVVSIIYVVTKQDG